SWRLRVPRILRRSARALWRRCSLRGPWRRARSTWRSSARIDDTRRYRSRRFLRPKIGVVQDRSHRALDLLDLVRDERALQGSHDGVLGFAERDRPHRNHLVDVEGRRIGEDYGNLARLQVEDRLVRLGQRSRTTRADIDVGRRSLQTGMFGGFLLQFVGVLTSYPALIDLVGVSLLLVVGWFGRLPLALVARNDDALQGGFLVLLAVLLVVVLNLLVRGMRELLGDVLIQGLGEDLVLGELHDQQHAGIIFYPHGAGVVGKGEQLGILGRKVAHHVRRHGGTIRRRKRLD